jgi:hypothetical protein
VRLIIGMAPASCREHSTQLPDVVYIASTMT